MSTTRRDSTESPAPSGEDSAPPTPANRHDHTTHAHVTELEGWTFLTHIKMNDLYTVSKLRCTKTKLDLIHAHVPGPHIHCYWVISHKVEDDLGLPHILQHMIFTGGSKSYLTPGFIHRAASRSISSGMKSWVERDHSCYYIAIAGKVGFEQMLPVAFDHIFNPYLQEASFLQEVYHVDGTGADHGTCLEEMINLEWNPEMLATMEMIRTAFGDESAYSFNFAGKSQILREQELSLVDKVKQFHEKFYHLSNCCLVICGDITKQELLPLLNNIIGTGGSFKTVESWEKPWLSEPMIEPINEPKMSRIEYPCLNVDPRQGSYVKIGILGPASTEKLNRCVAMRLVLEYLVTGPLFEAVAVKKSRRSLPGPNMFDESHVCTGLTVSEHEMRQTLFTIDCQNVPVDMISTVGVVIRRAIEQHITYEYEFDYHRMVQVVERVYNQELTSLETILEEKICRTVTPDFLYASQDSDLMFDRRVNSAYTIHHFLNQPADFWKHVIQECILDVNWITVAAIPSKSLADQIQEDEEQRRSKRLDPQHIKDTKRIAQRYKGSVRLFQSQQVAAVDELAQFQLPPVSSIGFMHITRQDNPRWAEDTLCNLYVDDVNSSYVFLTIIMDTTELTLEEKKYLVLFAEGLLNSPFVDSSDQFHSAEEMTEFLQRDCMRYEVFFGLEWLGRLVDRTKFSCGSFPHLLCLRFQLEVTKIREGFYWAQNLLWNTKWQADKLRQTCQKLVLEVDNELKHLGPVMTRAMLTDSLYLLNSSPKAISLIRQKSFLRKLGDDLPKSMRRVSKMLENIRMTLLRPENCTVHVAGSLSMMEFNLTEDPNARDAVAQLLGSTFDYTGWHWGYITKRLSNAPDMNQMRSPECIAKCSREQILRMERADECYLIQAAPGIRSWQDADYPLLLTAVQYFIQPDGGPLHKAMVEPGLVEEVDIRISPSEGLVYFEMRNCQNIAETYGNAFDVMAKHCSDEALDIETGKEGEVWNEDLLISAKSSMIYRLTMEEETPQHVAMLSLLSYYKKVNQLGHVRRHLMEKIAATTLNQVCLMTLKYLKPLFLQPCTCAASVPKDKAISTIQTLMERCGKRLTLIPPVEHSNLASYNQ